MNKSFILTLTIVFTLNSASLFAQQSEKKLSKKEKKELKKKEAEEAKAKIYELMETKKWVFEVDQVFDQENRNFQLNPTINFLAVKDKQMVMRLGFNQLPGWNGIDEANVDSDVTSYEIKEDKSNTAKMRMRFQGRDVGSAFIDLTVSSNNEARGQIIGEFGERLTVTGRFVPLSQSKVFNIQTAF